MTPEDVEAHRQEWMALLKKAQVLHALRGVGDQLSGPYWVRLLIDGTTEEREIAARAVSKKGMRAWLLWGLFLEPTPSRAHGGPPSTQRESEEVLALRSVTDFVW